MEKVEKVYNDVWNNLKERFEQDKEFLEELERLTHFYGRKFIPYAKNDEQLGLVEQEIGNLIKSQFFQGYFTMTTLLSDEETTLDENAWKQKRGIIRNELPLLMEETFENSNWYHTKLGHTISMKLIQEFDGVYDLLKQIRKDVALHGVYKAFIDDDRYIGEQETEGEGADIILDDPFDLKFLNPQIYIQTQFITDEQRIYDVMAWSSLTTNGWMGTIHLSQLPMEDNQSFYLLEFTISETISLDERYELLERILNTLPQEIRSVLQTRVYHVRELEVLVPATE